MSKLAFRVIALVVIGWNIVQANKRILIVDENWVCGTKQSCISCLRLTQCQWCGLENKCFSPNLTIFDNFCTYDALSVKDFGFSLEKNAECTCSGEASKEHCRPPNAADTEQDCSGHDRGKCVCGRCVCNDNFDPDHPTKKIVGEFCEYDNFSCDGPSCNEGPYPMHPPPAVTKSHSFLNFAWP